MALTKVSRGLLSTGIVDNSNATAITIDSSENVGIGKAVPAYILDIEGASPRMWMKDTTASGSHFEIGVDTSAVGLGNRANLPLNLFTNNTTRMTIASSGSVGIGGSTITDVNLLNIQGSGASKNIGVVFNDTNTSKIFAIQNGGSALKFFDYTASAERARIDASGNLLVGKTTTAFGTVGIRLEGPNGKIEATRNNNIVMDLNRLSGDGAIANFSKDGTTVGSWRSRSGLVSSLVLDPRSTNSGCGIGTTDGLAIVSTDNTGALVDSGKDLGQSGVRWRDLYLSGKANTGSITTDNANTQFNKISRTGAVALYVQQGDNTNDILQLRSGNGQAGTGTQQVTVKANGNLLVGTTTAGEGINYGSAGITTIKGTYGALIKSTGGSGYEVASFWNAATSGTRIQAVFRDSAAGTGRGTITTNGTSTSYNTSSDQRLKENIADADDAGSKIDAIQVRKYDWKADGSHQDYGMIAQELQAVAPEAVSGDADSEEMMGVDYSKLVPMLIKEIQSLRNRVAQLETGE